ncbi:MAG: hypothetical protein ACR2K6_03170 [Solirubrobacterales bacterium]
MSTDQILEELERELDNARPIPLTDQVRLDGDRLRKLLQQLREALASER